MLPRALASALSLCLTLASASAAALTQPDGAPIPNNGNLKSYLDAEGESIDPSVSAATTPQTFDPSCNLTFKVLARGGSQLNSFGWYNVTGQKPAPSDLHEFLGCNDAVGTEKTLAIKSDPAYKGGKIGFFMASTEGKTDKNCVSFGPGGPDPATLGHLYYSEPQYNDDNKGADSYIHLIVLDSKKFPKAFYFGWEDLFGGGDNDFEDLLTRVTGISCEGGGVPCETGKPGVCAQGILQCRDGKLSCLETSSSSPEQCNGADDDCNGKIDDGDKLCAEGLVCFRGNCVKKCSTGEFACPSSLTCDNGSGFCVDPACVGKTCPEGSVCRAGACKTPCEGIKCPAGKVCRLDLCVDPCAGVKCDGDTVCEGGVCKDKCGCGSCLAGKTCAPSGLCVDPGCESTSCDAGKVCVAGACADACLGATCPAGQSCKLGSCEFDPAAGGAGGAAGGGDGGIGGFVVSPAGAAGKGGSGGKGGSSGKGGSGGKGGSAGSSGKPKTTIVDETSTVEESDCGCRSAGSPAPATAAALLPLAAALLVRRRRR